MFSNVSQQNQLHLVSNLHRLVIWAEVHLSYVHPRLFRISPFSRCSSPRHRPTQTQAQHQDKAACHTVGASPRACASVALSAESGLPPMNLRMSHSFSFGFHPKVTFSQWGLPWHPLTKYAFLPIWLVHLFLALLFIHGLHCLYVCVCVCVLCHVRLFAISWAIVLQAPLSMAFSRQK